jgi:hypothetical protein
MTCAKIPAGISICWSVCEALSFWGTGKSGWGNKAPAWTMSQIRTLFEVIFPWRKGSGADVLE